MNELSQAKQEAKVRMQALIDKALVQDEVFRVRRRMLRQGSTAVYMSVSLPIAFLTLYALYQQGQLHGGHQYGASLFMLRHGLPRRKIYDPELYQKQTKVRPYESMQFTN